VETQRFERLMEYFKNEDNNIDFMVSPYRLLITIDCAALPQKPRVRRWLVKLFKLKRTRLSVLPVNDSPLPKDLRK